MKDQAASRVLAYVRKCHLTPQTTSSSKARADRPVLGLRRGIQGVAAPWHGHVSDVIGLRRAAALNCRSVLAPRPAADLRHVLTVLSDVLLVLDEFVADRLLGIGGSGAQLRHTVD